MKTVAKGVKMAKKVLKVFLLSSCLFFRAQAVLESYLPVLEQQAHTDRDQLIERYLLKSVPSLSSLMESG